MRAHHSRRCEQKLVYDECDLPGLWRVETTVRGRRRDYWACEQHARDAMMSDFGDVTCRNEHGERQTVGADGELVES